MNLIQLWNFWTLTACIRKSRNEASPHGKPDVIYHIPELFGGEECIQPVDTDELEIITIFFTTNIPSCDEEYYETFQYIMTQGNLQTPSTLDEADDLLVYLLDFLDDHLNDN